LRDLRELASLSKDVRSIESNANKRKKREASIKAKPEENSPPPSNNYDSEVIDCICGNNKDLGNSIVLALFSIL
jgi:hypothetical protein